MNSINSKIIKFNYLYNFYYIIILLFILYNIKKNIKSTYIQIYYVWFRKAVFISNSKHK